MFESPGSRPLRRILSSHFGANVQTFSANGVWLRPPNGTMVYMQLWAGGASGASTIGSNTIPGGGGGGYFEALIPLSLFSATETIVIGPGGTARSGLSNNGLAGGNTSFTQGGVPTYFAYGGGGPTAANNTVGGGGGSSGTASSPGFPGTATLGGNSAIGSHSLAPLDLTSGTLNTLDIIWAGAYGGDPAIPQKASAPMFGGGGGGGSLLAGGPSGYGGGGGAGCGLRTSAVVLGGASIFGGNGGNSGNNSVAATAGMVPSGGGGASANGSFAPSGAGGNGQGIITVF